MKIVTKPYEKFYTFLFMPLWILCYGYKKKKKKGPHFWRFTASSRPRMEGKSLFEEKEQTKRIKGEIKEGEEREQ